VLPRRIWVAKAELYHASRSRATSWGRKRSALDDQLISKLVDFALSSYVKIRRLGQTYVSFSRLMRLCALAPDYGG
jgi:proteasome activator subunit 4